MSIAGQNVLPKSDVATLPVSEAQEVVLEVGESVTVYR
jgi:hypothetical protein